MEALSLLSAVSDPRCCRLGESQRCSSLVCKGMRPTPLRMSRRLRLGEVIGALLARDDVAGHVDGILVYDYY
jgi:hypothetical protein